MQMDSMFLLIDILVSGYGIYTLYAYFLLVTKGEIKENILFSKSVSFHKCKDKEGYKKYIAPKILIFGIGTLICGVLGFINDYTGILGSWYLAVTVLFLILLAWYVTMTKKGVKRFW